MHLRTALGTLLALCLCTGIGAAKAPTTITVPMTAENNSGENGTATLTQTAKGVHVVVEIRNAPADAQPTHIHPGTCAKLNPAPEYPLTSLTNGKSVSDLPGKKLSDLTGGKFSVNVHKSSSDLATYVSCGQIK
jgi:hypothetical protein